MKNKTCTFCNNTGKALKYPDGTVVKYVPALATDSYHKAVTVIKCPECTKNGD